MNVSLGRVVVTQGALRCVTHVDILATLARHAMGDWGDVDAEDRRANNEALETGARLLSAYHSIEGKRFWIITEADRSVTTILLPEEY